VLDDSKTDLDSFGQEISRKLPLGQQEEFRYNDLGQESLHISFEGVVKETLYYTTGVHAGQVSQLRFFDNSVDYAGGAGTPRERFVYSYDTQGRETQAIQHLADGAVRVVDKSYDSEGRLTRIVLPEGAINYSYDTIDRLASISTGNATNPEDETRYTYDALHRLKTVTAVKRNGSTLSPPAKTSYKYDAVGNLDRTDQANGVIVDYIYDNLYRLDQLIQYSPDETPSDLSNNTKLASFDYNYRADGNRVSEAGFIAGYGPANYEWDYDALGRLTKETFTSNVTTQNFTAKYEFDLSSNRVRKTIDKFNNSTIDEVLTSLYDSNDRQLSETSSLGKVTSFTYNQTQQATKTVKQSGVTQETMSMQYNLQGMLDSAAVQDHSSGVLSRVEKSSYRYSTEGTRVSSKHEIDSNVDNIFESFTITRKLTDSLSSTGYSQVLQETTTDHLGNFVKSIDYTLGFDQISQTVATSSNPIPVTHYFQTDGHGSTRLLTTPGGSIVNTGAQNELYHYDAYGLPINFDSSTALTSYLKDSEPLDVHTNLIHLRARDYNFGQGVFTTLDGYSGNHLDPLSFNKYQFVHANPVMGVDPSGNEFSIVGLSGALAGISNVRSKEAGQGAQGLKTAKDVGDMIRTFQKALKLYDKALSRLDDLYQFAQDAYDLLSIDLNDVADLAKQISGTALSRLPTGRVQFTIKVPEKLRDKIMGSVGKYAGGLLRSSQVQEILGEFGTSMLVHAMGFKQTPFHWKWANGSNQGPDQIAEHQSLGHWGIFEAKGGNSRLGTAHGGQMGQEWLEKHLDVITESHNKNPVGARLKNTYDSKIPMLAAIVRVNLTYDRNPEIKITMQKFVKGRRMLPWGDA
jgi:RHS repeat-associated protein